MGDAGKTDAEKWSSVGPKGALAQVSYRRPETVGYDIWGPVTSKYDYSVPHGATYIFREDSYSCIYSVS